MQSIRILHDAFYTQSRTLMRKKSSGSISKDLSLKVRTFGKNVTAHCTQARRPNHTCEKIDRSIFLLQKWNTELAFWSFDTSNTKILVIYQTRETVFYKNIQTPRRELKIRRAAEYFWLNSRSLDSRWNTVSNVWYIFSIQAKTNKRRSKIVKIYIN